MQNEKHNMKSFEHISSVPGVENHVIRKKDHAMQEIILFNSQLPSIPALFGICEVIHGKAPAVYMYDPHFIRLSRVCIGTENGRIQPNTIISFEIYENETINIYNPVYTDLDYPGEKYAYLQMFRTDSFLSYLKQHFRTDKDLIARIKNDDALSHYTKLIEIPDDVEYDIVRYLTDNGTRQECIVEKHRCWECEW